MKKNIKKSFIAMMFALVLILPIQTPAVAKIDKPQLDNAITQNTKQPVGKKQLAMKFLLAMGGVATSSIVLYIGLSLYNKIFRNTSTSVGLKNLRTPVNFKQALHKFLDVTDWE